MSISKKEKELVLTIDAGWTNTAYNHPFIRGYVDELEHHTEHGFAFRRRGAVEDNPKYKQVIPYVLVRHRGTNRFLLYQRAGNIQENRLQNKYSLGLGGHINPCDAPVDGGFPLILHNALYREVYEEVSILPPTFLEPVGVLNDNTEPVGLVHVGAVYELMTGEELFEVKEPQNLTARWATIEEIQEVYSLMENWSRLVFDNYIACPKTNT
jgi:predicted NUDIX family phosphoesterase